MKENWRAHPRFEKYEVSDQGRVRRRAPGVNTVPGRVLKQFPRGPGYLGVHPSGAQCQLVHAMVLETFLGACPDAEARHLDGDRTNNQLSNLRWGTAFENAQDRDRHGTTAKGERGGRAVLSDYDVRVIRFRYVPRIVTHAMLAAEYGVAVATVSHITNRRNWRHI